MALLELGGKKLTIPAGDSLLGADAACAVQLTGPGILPKHAAFQATADGQVVIRKATPEAEVLINGVRLGAEPTPLLHGDKVEVGGHELTFVDERRSGSTMYVQAMNVPQAMAQVKGAAGGKVTGNTGGRVVCLTDGREYAIAGSSLVFGRDATCDVVVPGKDVSRRHAEIVPTPKGYLLVDSSTNGTFVNEERIEGQRILARTDVIRIGDENFRFYADAAPAAAAAPPAPPPPAAPNRPPPAAGGAGGPPPGGGNKLRDTMHGAPGEPAAPRPAGTALANFLVRAGSLKGQRLQVRTPIANIGRADYNDLIIPDESVSTAHAKLQRREGVWVLVDLDSTNGTFVDGEQLKGEAPLAPGATVRFGDVSLVFEPTDEALGVAKGGGTRVMERPVMQPPPVKAAPPPVRPRASPAAPAKSKAASTSPARRPAAQQPAPKKQGKGCGSSAAVVVLGVAAAIYWILA